MLLYEKMMHREETSASKKDQWTLEYSGNQAVHFAEGRIVARYAGNEAEQWRCHGGVASVLINMQGREDIYNLQSFSGIASSW